MSSCSTCPRRVPADETSDTYKRSLGADVCYTRGIVVSRPGLSTSMNAKIQTEIASKCPDYGQPRTGSPSNLFLNVAVGDPTAMQTSHQNATLRTNRDSSMGGWAEAPSACTFCTNYIAPEVVRAELGWGLGLCAAKGDLIMPATVAQVAEDCGIGMERHAGIAPRDTTDGVILMPQYDPGAGSHFLIQNGVITAKSAESPHSVDPRLYVTDKPVSAAEARRHIRAWRKIEDPEGEREPAWLPIFDGPTLYGYDPRTTYGGHRPDLYVDHAGLLYDMAVELMELDETPLLNGGAGVGKTELACYIAWLMDVVFIRHSIEKGTESWMLAGDNELVTDENGVQVTRFRKGPFTVGYEMPCVQVVDEPNVKQDVYEFLRPVLDNAKQLRLSDGTLANRNPYSFLILSQNPADDAKYVGTEPMNAADTDRISPIFMELPTENIERAIIVSRCADMGYDIPAQTLDQVMQISHDIRQLITEGTLQVAWGVRSNIKVARKTKFYSMPKAYRRAITDGMERQVAEDIMSVVTTVVG